MRITRFLLGLILVTSVMSTHAADIYFSDAFSGDGGRPAGWVFDAADNAYWQIQSGWLNTGNGDDLITADRFSFGLVNVPGSDSWEDGQISCRFWMNQANGSVVLFGRWRNRENHVRALLNVVEDNVILRIEKVSEGKVTPLASQSVDTEAMGLPPIKNGNQENALSYSLSLDGPQITASLGGRPILRARDPRPEEGQFGVAQRMNQVFFDDVIVQSAQDGAGAIQAIFHVELAGQVSQDQASEMATRVEEANQGPVLLRRMGEQYALWQGNYLTREEAEAALSNLRDQGLPVSRVVSEEMGQSDSTRAIAEGEEFFSVRVLSSTDPAMARMQANELRRQGYFPFIEQDAQYNKVLVGRFPSQSEARKMQAQMKAEGFSFAQTVSSKELAMAQAPTQAAASKIQSKALTSPEWENLTSAQQEQVLNIIASRRAMRQGLQSTEELLELKKRVDALDEQQKQIVVDLTQAEDIEQKRQQDIRQIVNRVNRQVDEGDYDGALALLDRLEEMDPASPIPSFKRERIDHLKAGTFFGQEQLQKSLEQKLSMLEKRAEELANQGKLTDLEQALLLYVQILSEAPDSSERAQRAQGRYQEIDRQIAQRRAQMAAEAKKQARSERMMVMGVLLGVVVVFLVILAVLIVAGRRRYSRMLQQLQEEAIVPLQALQQRTRGLSAATPEGLTFEQSDQSLLSEEESPDAEFMIAETEEEEYEIEAEEEEEPLSAL
ncbi:SPOR domain-containing protein, partial [bacterium]|nr:SPOR domain-containing protein [bacterium]